MLPTLVIDAAGHLHVPDTTVDVGDEAVDETSKAAGMGRCRALA